jgi:hypothetical protein
MTTSVSILVSPNNSVVLWVLWGGPAHLVDSDITRLYWSVSLERMTTHDVLLCPTGWNTWSATGARDGAVVPMGLAYSTVLATTRNHGSQQVDTTDSVTWMKL